MTLPYRAYGKPTLNDSFAANQVFRQAERIPESSDSGILFIISWREARWESPLGCFGSGKGDCHDDWIGMVLIQFFILHS